MTLIEPVRKISNGVRGIALLFTLLITSLIFTISLGVYNLIVGGIVLSGTGRESQLAFYAADAGAECALFWDLKHPGLDQSAFDPTLPVNDIPNACAGADLQVGGSSVSNFDLTFDNGSCVAVRVEKELDQTIVNAQGQNTCAATGRRVERGIEVTY